MHVSVQSKAEENKLEIVKDKANYDIFVFFFSAHLR